MVTTAKKTTAKKAAAAPARKTTTSKPAATKSASAPPAKRTAPSTAKKTAPANPDNDDEATEKAFDNFSKQVFTMIKTGAFDACFTALIDAVEEREGIMARMVKEENDAKRKKPAPKKTTEEKVVPMPTRTKSAAAFTPEVGSAYLIADGHPLKGAKVTFVGFHKDDETKSRVKMVTDAPGAPIGKGVIVPTNMLKKPAARGRRTAKK